MVTRARRNPIVFARRTVAVLAALTCAVVVIGCTPPNVQPRPSESAIAAEAPTPTPTADVGAYFGSEPQSSSEAVEVGTLVYQQYVRTYAEVYRHPADTSLIDEIATGQAAASVKEGAEVMVDDDWRVQYDDRFTVDASRSQGLPHAADDGRDMAFRTVELVGCLDLTRRSGTWGPEQAPLTFDTSQRVQISVHIEYWPSDGTFMVIEDGFLGGVETPC